MSKTSAILIAKEVDGVEMGVMANGTPFLTGRGLAKACGVAPSAIIKQADAWKQGKRDGALAKLLVDLGYDEDSLFVPVDNNGTRVHAYTDSVCTVVIEYYALNANSEDAKKIYRVLAREGLRNFIYKATGFKARSILPGWDDFHERLLLSSSPSGYYSIYREAADFVLRAVQAGLVLDSKNIIDISIGGTWGAHWRDHNLEDAHGMRKKYEHNFPDGYPQAATNPQDIWVYPVESLGAFRRWLDEVYIPSKLPNYLNSKVKKRVMARNEANMLLAAVTPAQLDDSDSDDSDDE